MSDQTLPRPPDGDQGTHPAAAPPGYELLEEVGRGAMGVVYRARELALGRTVAVKVLLAQIAPGSSPARRFLEEARITGRLQHPNVPPIHHVGALADGRPFLAMKLIAGRTLADELAGRPAASDDRGHLLAVFEQIAQAVGFAHAEGVIHRDLKPQNVMVGAFGEVQVMDWGLAKDLRAAGSAPQAPSGAADGTLEHVPGQPLSSSASDATQAGSLLGTPAYMPPEQAIGAVDQITRRSDVFALGGILCVILTGSPPYRGADAESARQLAARARLEETHARLDACGAEPELIALAKRCLAPEPADRPADGGEVAAAVAALRADAERRAREAEMERAREAVRAAEGRKRRRVRRALVTALLALFAVAALAAWWVQSERSARRADRLAHQAELEARRLKSEHDVLAELNQVQVLREEGWKQDEDLPRWELTLKAARSALQRAEGLLGASEPTDELRGRVAAAERGLSRDEQDRALLDRLDRVGEENDIRLLFSFLLTDGPSRRYAEAFRAHGIDLATVPTDEAVAWLKAHRFRDRLTAAVRSWHLAQPIVSTVKPSLRGRLTVILDAVTEDPFARQWWAAVARNDAATLKALLARPEVSRMRSRDLASLADGLADPQHRYEAAMRELLRLAYDRFPGDFWVNLRLASTALMGPPPTPTERADVLRHLNASVAARPSSGVARAVLGSELAQRRKGDPTGMRMLRAAAEMETTSAWPGLFLGMAAAEGGD